MTRRDRWKKRPCVVRYFEYRDQLRAKAIEYGITLPNDFTVTFYMAMPKSWSKKKKAALVGKPCMSKPDLDNVLKGFMDALRTNDASVYAVSASKFWSEQPGVVLAVRVPSPAWRPNWAV
jgi:Holliday junction resolvase RusA-like endonuclease